VTTAPRGSIEAATAPAGRGRRGPSPRREKRYRAGRNAADAASALPIIESGLPIDLLFTDVVMPGPLRSPELARKAKERLPNIAVLFTSGYTENAIVHGGRLDAGVEL